MKTTWLKLLTAALLLFSAAAVLPGAALAITDYQAKLNPRFQKTRRQSTALIIVHTSEAGQVSTLRTLSEGKAIGKSRTRGGHAHYAVGRDGRVYRILHHSLRADHAGLSMWNGVRDVSDISVGIELVGYHNQDLTARQYEALKQLLIQLRAIYKIPEKNVLAHSQVAYGNPNRWFKRPHRGRKRCALNLDRRRAGLSDQWSYDPDVRAGRLLQDPLINRVFYSSVRAPAISRAVHDSNVISLSNTAWNIAGEDYNSGQTVYVLPSGKRVPGDRLQKEVGWGRLPAGTRVLLNQSREVREQAGPIFTIGGDSTAWSFAGPHYNEPSTFYFFPDRTMVGGERIRDWDVLPPGTRMIFPYRPPREIKNVPGQTAWGLAGRLYNDPRTVYLLPGGAPLSGDQVKDFSSLPSGTLIFLKID